MATKTGKKSKPTKKNPKGKVITREITLELTKEDYAKLGERESDLMNSVGKLEAEFSEVKSKWTARLDPLKAELTEVRATLKAKEEKKTLEVTQVMNYDEDTVEFWFAGKIVDTRPMTHQDRQDQMEFAQPKTRRGRDAKQLAANDVEKDEDKEISNVRKLETSRRTKHSSVDGPVNNGNGIEHPTGGAQ